MSNAATIAKLSAAIDYAQAALALLQGGAREPERPWWDDAEVTSGFEMRLAGIRQHCAVPSDASRFLNAAPAMAHALLAVATGGEDDGYGYRKQARDALEAAGVEIP